ncbi:MAG TPA: zinc-dependent alcohol dehydrogenase family protein [Dongiaceae bacterium]|nr:zinc-dependent alcohol dehydrogenase family protein [Dongiaceae bacterium]
MRGSRTMRAMVFNKSATKGVPRDIPGDAGAGEASLRAELVPIERPMPEAGRGQVLVKVAACAVCRTDLHILDGDLAHPKPDLVPGHEVVGRIVDIGAGVSGLDIGQRVGIPWLGETCGQCDYCRAGQENLCPAARFTGYDIDGGFGEFCVADARYCFPIPDSYDDAAAAPLLCAGLIGYRAYRQIGEAKRLGLYGFGAAAHILIQVARFEGREVYAFTKPGDQAAQSFARGLGAVWAGGSDEVAPAELDAAIIFAPVGALVPTALRAVRPAGVVICAGIHMSAIPSFPYEILWRERSLRSVANLTRADGEAFLALAPLVPVTTHITRYSLSDANRAIADLRAGRLDGAAVLLPAF